MYIYMTYPVSPNRNFSCASLKVASMAEANDSELGQEKQKGKNPVVENDLIGVGLSDGDVDEGGEGFDKKNKNPVVEDGLSDGDGDVDEGGEGIVDKKNKNPVVENGLSDGDVDEGGEGVVDRRGGEMGKNRKKREREHLSIPRGKNREEGVDGVVNKDDPLVLFGSDIMMKILRHLDARSVALSLLVSRRWHGTASSDRIWTIKCDELWLGKAHIPRSSQVRGLSKLNAYSISLMDGKRTRIMKEDLCNHVWEFHFNEAAPEYWRNLDPYWKGTGPPMRRYFHPDGSLTADPGDKVWGGHESCYSIVTSFVGEGRIREHYIRINRWPRMSVLRKDDWSWEMSNNVYCYTSVPDADKEGGTEGYVSCYNIPCLLSPSSALPSPQQT